MVCHVLIPGHQQATWSCEWCLCYHMMHKVVPCTWAAFVVYVCLAVYQHVCQGCLLMACGLWVCFMSLLHASKLYASHVMEGWVDAKAHAWFAPWPIGSCILQFCGQCRLRLQLGRGLCGAGVLLEPVLGMHSFGLLLWGIGWFR